MAVVARSFAKINLGLRIGPQRPDGFHQLLTVYQTLALHDRVRVDVTRGSGITLRCNDPAVPTDESNTCWRVTERVLKAVGVRGRVSIAIEKRLPVQGGLGAASSNAVATMLALERALKSPLEPEQRLRIAAEVGSDLPLFLVGGTVLGSGRGERVFPLEDLRSLAVVLVTPHLGVSTPAAFAAWDARKLTPGASSDRMDEFSRRVYAWLMGSHTGVPARGRDRAEALLLDLVRAGIDNDFERVVFPEYPELREAKRALERAGARFASLSGSGSTVFGLFPGPAAAAKAAGQLKANGLPAQATGTLGRQQYWKRLWAVD